MTMTYEQEIDVALRHLHRHYLAYAKYSRSKLCVNSEAEIAEKSMSGFLDYLNNSFEEYPHWKKNVPIIIYNQIRILQGFIECYDKPVIREKGPSNKTRWSL
jgi:hypothetical protein